MLGYGNPGQERRRAEGYPEPLRYLLDAVVPEDQAQAVITAGAKELAGNALNQNLATAGNQQKVWYVSTGSR